MADVLLGIDNNLIVVDNSLISPPDLVLQDKIVIPSETQQVISPDAEYNALSSVTVKSIQTEQKTVTPLSIQQVITPSSGKYLSKVTINSIYSIIGVTYPAGSTCTCTDGSTSFVAPDTTGQTIFNIPYIGIWTVMCYDGADYDSSEKKKSAEVNITTEGQSESVELKYGFYIYNNGIDSVSLSVSKTGTGTVTKGESFITLSTGKSNNVATAVVYTTDKIDLSLYTKAYLKYTVIERGTDASARIAVRTTPTGNIVADTSIINDIGDYIVSVDLSAVNRSLYITVSVGNGGNGASYYLTIQINSIWLEQ